MDSTEYGTPWDELIMTGHNDSGETMDVLSKINVEFVGKELEIYATHEGKNIF
jgi:hypothetical protein